MRKLDTRKRRGGMTEREVGGIVGREAYREKVITSVSILTTKLIFSRKKRIIGKVQ